MGGYFNLQEMLNQLDSMRLFYPGLISVKADAGNNPTIEGRTIYYVRISNNPDQTTTKPKVFYNALIHAREPMGMQQLVYFMWYLLENYSTSDEIKYLVDNLQLYFIPVVNPDGYEFNHTSFPSGGGMWRKNRRDNGGGNIGVDLNRNFGYKWGYDNTGSSPDPSNETYRGTGPFSEPETQVIRDFSTANVWTLSQNYHTYSDYTMYPWCWQTALTADSAIDIAYSSFMVRQNGYMTGTPGQILYNTNGDALDWQYGEQTTKPKELCFTTETGTQTDGFWPFANRIIPLAQENMYSNLMIAHFAIRYAEAQDASPVILSSRQGYFNFNFVRYGMDSPANYTVLYTFRDTVIRFFGPPLVIFSDSCNTMANWSSTKWNVTHAQYHSPTACLTDSPTGNYSNNSTVTITSANSLDLKNSPVVVINYWAKWRTEQGSDFVQFNLQGNLGPWTPQQGRYTKTSFYTEATSQPLYDGNQPAWVKEQIVTTGYTNKSLKMQFLLKSDQSVNYDGFYFDDVTVTVVDMSQVGISSAGGKKPVIGDPVPNPATGIAVVGFDLGDSGNQGKALFTLLDLKGVKIMEVAVPAGCKNITVPVDHLAPGVYLYRISGSFGSTEVKKLVVIH